MNLKGYSENCPTPMSSCNSTLTSRLMREKKELEERLAKVNYALDALEKNPEIQKIIDAVSSV